MKLPRSSGVLLHPTSLPGPGGIGTLGADAITFLDFLRDAGCTIWQMLPLGPTGYGDSPYQCYSAFAGNPLLISLPEDRVGSVTGNVDFATVIPAKRASLGEHFKRFVPDARYQQWKRQQPWLEDFALFSALKDAHHRAQWTDWPSALANREPVALQQFRAAHANDIEQVCFEQYVFARQYQVVRKAAAERGVRLMGDVPIYVAHDSADVWANRSLFKLDAEGGLLVQAGVPPDYFSETGQLWGNPIYDWDACRASGYRWWIERMRAALATFDILRLDHFRGFEAYWEVPGDAETAINGRWAPGPGAGLFEALTAALGPLPIVAENLGLITPGVESLREEFGYPGMGVLQFAFAGPDDGREFKPHLLTPNRVVYTGTHDNDTTLGWWNSAPGGDSTRTQKEIDREHKYALSYLDADGSEMNWTLIRAALASVADTVLVPMQDILGLGSEARMNLPGRESGNWQFRFAWEQLAPAAVTRLRELNQLFDR